MTESLKESRVLTTEDFHSEVCSRGFSEARFIQPIVDKLIKLKSNPTLVPVYGPSTYMLSKDHKHDERANVTSVV